MNLLHLLYFNRNVWLTIGRSHDWVMSVSLRVFVNIELLWGMCNDLSYRSCQIIKLPNRLKTRHYFWSGFVEKRWKIFDWKEMTKQDVEKERFCCFFKQRFKCHFESLEKCFSHKLSNHKKSSSSAAANRCCCRKNKQTFFIWSVAAKSFLIVKAS